MHRPAKAHTARWRLRFAISPIQGANSCGTASMWQVRRPRQAAIRNVMRRVSCGRQIAARDLVLALRAGLDARYFMGDRIVDRLIIAELEVQEWMMLDRAPMTSEQ